MTQMLLHLSKDCLFVRLLSNLMGTLPHIKFSLIRFILCIFFVRINPRTPRNSVWLGGFVVKKFVWCSALGRAQLFAFWRSALHSDDNTLRAHVTTWSVNDVMVNRNARFYHCALYCSSHIYVSILYWHTSDIISHIRHYQSGWPGWIITAIFTTKRLCSCTIINIHSSLIIEFPLLPTYQKVQSECRKPAPNKFINIFYYNFYCNGTLGIWKLGEISVLLTNFN